MHKYDGSANCSKETSRNNSPYIQVTVKQQRFEINRKTTEQWYPFHVKGGEDLFELYRRTNGQNKNNWSHKDYLSPKSEDWKKKLFIECTVSNFKRNSGQRLGCTVTSKLNDSFIIKYSYENSSLDDYQQVDTAIKNTVLNFRLENKR